MDVIRAATTAEDGKEDKACQAAAAAKTFTVSADTMMQVGERLKSQWTSAVDRVVQATQDSSLATANWDKSNLWINGVYVSGASELGERLLNLGSGCAYGGEELEDTVVINFGRTVWLRAVFLRVLWPKIGASKVPLHMIMHATIEDKERGGAWPLGSAVASSDYGFRLRLRQNQMVRGSVLRLKFTKRQVAPPPAGGDYKLRASMLILDAVSDLADLRPMAMQRPAASASTTPLPRIAATASKNHFGGVRTPQMVNLGACGSCV